MHIYDEKSCESVGSCFKIPKWRNEGWIYIRTLKNHCKILKKIPNGETKPSKSRVNWAGQTSNQQTRLKQHKQFINPNKSQETQTT